MISESGIWTWGNRLTEWQCMRKQYEYYKK